jgi:hypothetical protein
MMINNLEKSFEIPFEKKVILYRTVGLFLFTLGVIIVTLAFAFQNYFINDFMNGFYFGTGGGLAVAGITIAIYYFRLPLNKEKYKKREVEDSDERNHFIVTKSGYISFYLTLLIVYKAAIIAGFFSLPVFFALLGVLVLMLITLAITMLIMRALY